jgi:hypothetical protein
MSSSLKERCSSIERLVGFDWLADFLKSVLIGRQYYALFRFNGVDVIHIVESH